MKTKQKISPLRINLLVAVIILGALAAVFGQWALHVLLSVSTWRAEAAADSTKGFEEGDPLMIGIFIGLIAVVCLVGAVFVGLELKRANKRP